MKSAKYETSVGALAAYLASKPHGAFLCDLYTLTLVGSLNGGNPLTYTTADVDVTVPYASPVTYSSRQVYFDQLDSKAYGHWKIGLDVDTWQVIAAPSPQASIGGQPWLQALRAGVLDGAIVSVDRAFLDNRPAGMAQAPTSLSPLGVVNIFTGRVAEIDLGRSNSVISVNSHLELLNVNMPRNLYQAGCRWSLFGAGCTLSAATYAVSGSIAAAATAANVISATVAAPGGSGTYALGRLVMTGGRNAGFARSIRSWVPGSPATVTLLAPFPYAVAAGDSFTAYPGCDKQLSSCLAFQNTANFGGAPFIPAPETAV